jgi:hypothetical protein
MEKRMHPMAMFIQKQSRGRKISSSYKKNKLTLKNELRKSAGGKGRWKKSIEFGGEVINYDLLSPSRIVLYRIERIKWRGTSNRDYVVNVYRHFERGLDLVSHKVGLTQKQATNEIKKAMWSINNGIGDIIGF